MTKTNTKTQPMTAEEFHKLAQSQLVSIADAARLAGIAKCTLQRWIALGKITTLGRSPNLRVFLSDVLPVNDRKQDNSILHIKTLPGPGNTRIPRPTSRTSS